MKIFTTINPKSNFEAQNEAIQSWLKKYEVISVNTEEEISEIKEIYPDVNFISTNETYQYKNKKLIKFDSILSEMSKINGYSFFLNSDIILKEDMEISINERHLNNGIYLSTRYDVDDDSVSFFKWGFDFFCIHSKYLHHFKNEKFAIGLPWWDYWLPICAYMNGFNLYHLDYELFYHRKHETNYDMEKWKDLGKDLYFYLKPLIPKEEFKFEEFMQSKNGVMLIKKFIDSKLINIKQSYEINL
jgi:hypothetical protein